MEQISKVIGSATELIEWKSKKGNIRLNFAVIQESLKLFGQELDKKSSEMKVQEEKVNKELLAKHNEYAALTTQVNNAAKELGELEAQEAKSQALYASCKNEAEKAYNKQFENDRKLDTHERSRWVPGYSLVSQLSGWENERSDLYKKNEQLSNQIRKLEEQMRKQQENIQQKRNFIGKTKAQNTNVKTELDKLDSSIKLCGTILTKTRDVSKNFKEIISKCKFVKMDVGMIETSIKEGVFDLQDAINFRAGMKDIESNTSTLLSDQSQLKGLLAFKEITQAKKFTKAPPDLFTRESPLFEELIDSVVQICPYYGADGTYRVCFFTEPEDHQNELVRARDFSQEYVQKECGAGKIGYSWKVIPTTKRGCVMFESVEMPEMFLMKTKEGNIDVRLIEEESDEDHASFRVIKAALNERQTEERKLLEKRDRTRRDKNGKFRQPIEMEDSAWQTIELAGSPGKYLAVDRESMALTIISKSDRDQKVGWFNFFGEGKPNDQEDYNDDDY